MIGSWLGLVWSIGKETVLSFVSPVDEGPRVAVARLRSSLLVWIRSTGVPGTRSYHIACRPLASAVIHGWKRSFMVVRFGAALICCGALQCWFPSREKLRKIRVAFELSPPTPFGRSFQAAYSTPFWSTVVLTNSKLRASWPRSVSITSRRSTGLLQATILSPDPLVGAMVVMPTTFPSPRSTVAIRSLPAVMVKSVHPSGTLSNQET